MIYPGTRTGGELFIHDNGFGPAPFRPAGRRPVKGGRWKIRKRRWGERRWAAMNTGAARGLSRRFDRWEDAIAHATFVANMFAEPTPENVRKRFQLLRPGITEERLNHLVMRYAVVKTPRRRRAS